MKPPKSRFRLFSRPPKTLFEDDEDELHSFIKGPLFSRPVFRTLLAVFAVFLVLTVDWFGLLLLNSQGVFGQIGSLNTLRVTAALMGGIAIPSALLMLHYRGLYTYNSDEDVFFAITFSLSFMLGMPCALAALFA
jgi:hypothetical protein